MVSVPAAALARAPGGGGFLQCEQRAGDVVYLPAGTWHATYSYAETTYTDDEVGAEASHG